MGVVVVAERLGLVATESVEFANHGAVGLVVAVDRVTIEGDGDGLALAELLLEEDWRVMVMVVVSLAAVAAEAVELAEGLGVAQISKQLYISESTTKTHISKLYDKLGAGNRAQALMTALRLGLLKQDDVSS